jgi:hypothetical protein
LVEIGDAFRSGIRRVARHEREEVSYALARQLGFAGVTDTSRDAIKSANNSAIRHAVLG